MDCEVVVVGGGIGGLTVAALLAARGIDVCLFERQSAVGGCASNFSKFGFEFEQSDGLYSSWEPGGIHDRIFSELPVDSPEVMALEPAYAVRLSDRSQIVVGAEVEKFEEGLRSVFPECATEAVQFYREIHKVGSSLRKSLQAKPDLFWSGSDKKELPGGLGALLAGNEPVSSRVTRVSDRFRRFINSQLQILTQGRSEDVPYLQAALVLSQTRGGLFAIRGGAASLASRLVESIKLSGGRLRVDAPVLRLAYDSDGQATGVDLLSGERVTASKAIVSNLTLWDTYGKLVGLARTPSDVRSKLKTLHSWGAYLLFLSVEEAACRSLVADRVLSLIDGQPENESNPESNQLFLNASPKWDARAPAGKRAVTIHAFTNSEDWFSFHTDAEEIEMQDQATMEDCWNQLHVAMPELGSEVEVIETMTPRDFYESTRRKLGMVGSAYPLLFSKLGGPPFLTSLPNLFVVSDTAHWGGLAGVSRLALALADHLSTKKS